MSAVSPTPVPMRGRSVSRYEPLRPVQPIDLWLDSNEGTPPPSEWLGQSALQCAGSVSRYSSPKVFEGELAQRFGVDPQQVVVTAGADDALERVCRHLLAPGSTLALTNPTFEMIPRYAALAGADLREIPWLGSTFPRAQFCAAIGPDCPLAYIASPNNPTGAAISEADLRAISASAGDTTIVLLDLAYTEFADCDLTTTALELPNVVVTRTMSKAWGLAGLRVGWAIAPTNLASELRRIGQPYAVSTLSLSLAASWLKDGGPAVTQRIDRVRFERRQLESLLIGLGGSPVQSSGNFLLCRFERASTVADLLAGCGMAVRRFPAASRLSSYLRITCPGDEEKFDRLCASLRSCMRPQALLFDMDGVLADVSGSYRRAIIETARSFGVSLSPQDVAYAKAQPDSNNDWRVTHRLLNQRGIDANLAEVTERFEAIYGGQSGGPALWESERCLINAGTLRSLAERVPLGIVTGRPRRDAERFLERHGLRDYFQTLVCMEDAPLKPDPAPLRLAMSLLGVREGWYVGDTRDDIAAAKAAAMVPIGCLSPSDDASAARTGLLAVGAGVVLSSVNELSELLP